MLYLIFFTKAVLDTLYKNQSTPINEIESFDQNDLFINQQINDPELINDDLKNILANLRLTIKKFTQSPKNSNILQNFSSKKLQIDCKTRWNSMCLMMKSYFDISSEVKNALVFMGEDILLSNKDEALLKLIQESLEPVESTVNELSKYSANIITADIIFSTLIDRLLAQNNNFSKTLASNIEARIMARRTRISDIAWYLFKDKFPGDANKFYKPIENDEICFIYEKFIKKTEINKTIQDLAPSSKNQSLIESSSLNVIEASKNLMEDDCTVSSTSILVDLNIFNTTSTMTPNLKEFARKILSISPTSTSCERTFSTCGQIVCPLRSNISESLLNAIIVIKYYYLIKNV